MNEARLNTLLWAVRAVREAVSNLEQVLLAALAEERHRTSVGATSAREVDD